MYRLFDYRAMVQDATRTPAHVRAIRRAVRPGDTVLDIGCGFGYFALVACQAGADRVFAVDPDSVIQLGPELARANGFADRIEFIQRLSTQVSIEPVDVMISDLRGVLPLFGRHIPVVADARRRLLKPGGRLLPARDTVWLALSDHEDAAADSNPADLDLGPVEHAFVNLVRGVRVRKAELVSAPAALHTIDFASVTDPDVQGDLRLIVEREGSVSGFAAWFDTDLYEGIGFSTAPGEPDGVYGHAFFPLPERVPVRPGDVVHVRLRAVLVGDDYVWSWEGSIAEGTARQATFAQSTFKVAPLEVSRLRRRADAFTPRLSRAGHAQAWMLGRMSGSASLGDIAREALGAYPELFADVSQALRAAADLAEQLSD